MKEDFSELVEYLDTKFNKVEGDLALLKTDVALLKTDLGTVKSDVSGLKESFNDIQTSVDKYAGKADKYFEEMVAWSSQVKRHEKWLQMIAEKVGIKLEY